MKESECVEVTNLAALDMALKCLKKAEASKSLTWGAKEIAHNNMNNAVMDIIGKFRDDAKISEKMKAVYNLALVDIARMALAELKDFQCQGKLPEIYAAISREQDRLNGMVAKSIDFEDTVNESLRL